MNPVVPTHTRRMHTVLSGFECSLANCSICSATRKRRVACLCKTKVCRVWGANDDLKDHRIRPGTGSAIPQANQFDIGICKHFIEGVDDFWRDSEPFGLSTLLLWVPFYNDANSEEFWQCDEKW